MRIEKPTLTAQMRARGNDLYRYMRSKADYCTKEELCAAIGWKYNKTNDRRIRELVCEILGAVKPIIARSDNRGYKLAQTPKDVEEALHCWREIDSRIETYNRRKAPLIKFCEEYNA